MSVPFLVEGVTIGTLLLLNKLNGYVFSKSDFLFLEKFAAIVSPFIRDIKKIQQYFITPLPQEALLKKYEANGLLGKSEKFLQLLLIRRMKRCNPRY